MLQRQHTGYYFPCLSCHVNNSRPRLHRTGATRSDNIIIGLAGPEDYWYAADVHCRVFYEQPKPGLQPDEGLLAQARGFLSRVDRVLAQTTNDGLAREGAGRAALLVAYQRSSSTAQPNIMADRAERAYFEAVSPAQPASSLPSTAPSSSPGIPHAGDSTSTSTSRSSGSDLGPRSSVPDTIDQGGGPARPSNNPAHTQGDLPWTLRAGWWLVPPSARGGMGRQAEWSHSVAVANLDSFGDLIPPKTLSPTRDGAVGWYKRPGVAYLSNVAVLPAARRQGIARKIVDAAEQLAASWDCTAIGLHCSPQNTAAVQLYRAMGFKPTHVLENPLIPYLSGRAPERCQLFLKRIPNRLRRVNVGPSI